MNECWTTIKGKKLPLATMTDEHLANAEKMLAKRFTELTYKASQIQNGMLALRAEQIRRKDAQAAKRKAEKLAAKAVKQKPVVSAAIFDENGRKFKS